MKRPGCGGWRRCTQRAGTWGTRRPPRRRGTVKGSKALPRSRAKLETCWRGCGSRGQGPAGLRAQSRVPNKYNKFV